MLPFIAFVLAPNEVNHDVTFSPSLANILSDICVVVACVVPFIYIPPEGGSAGVVFNAVKVHFILSPP